MRSEPPELGLFTDLYELTMLESYLATGMEERATFSLFVRKLPRHRAYLVAAGLADALRCLEELTFSPEAIDWLRATGRFSERLLAYLRAFRFSGEIQAIAEGTLVFGEEPLLEVEAPLPEAQLAETLLINQLHLQTMIASKAARVVEAAQGRSVVDFGARRAHGIDAGVKAARAAYVAGVDATSNVMAGFSYGIPMTGTMAHSFIQAHDSELTAFRNFTRLYPRSTLLVDTYDTMQGVKNAIQISKEPGVQLSAIRLDSGDLGVLSRASRKLLDDAGLTQVKIVASGGLDEFKVDALVREGAPIDAFGVGTALTTSGDSPHLDMAYKLVSYAGEDRLKLSSGKQLYPGPKQVYRIADGSIYFDVLARRTETGDGRPLLRPVMRNGRALPAAEEPLDVIRERAREEREKLPESLRTLEEHPPRYRVEVSAGLQAQAAALRTRWLQSS